MLTDAQLPAFKTLITTDPVFADALAVGNDTEVARLANEAASPTYWVWKTSIFESEITRQPSADATVWSWTAYIARSQGERDAWARLFVGGGSGMNPSLTNVRQGVADIFSGSANSAPAQRTHLLAICRRAATRAEKLYAVAATGPGNDGVANNRGTTTNPDALGFEGKVTEDDVARAKRLP